jgi:hypothetical protein
MQRFRITTLIDITRSRASRSETDKTKIGQQSNFNSFTQSIGLRSNIEWKEDPQKNQGRLPEPIEGKAAHWVWEIEIERDDTYLKDNDPCYFLREDLHGVPIIVDLENTADITPPAIQTRGNNQNTWIEII